MTNPTPNFKRGAPPERGPAPTSDGSWVAKFDGTCDYCGGAIDEGIDRVRWNEEGTKVVHASHR